MRRGWHVTSLIVTTIAATGALSPGWAEEPIAHPSVGTTSITWSPNIANEGFVLTVTGPERLSVRQEFEPGATPAFEVVEARGNRLPDGSYSWELRANPVVAPDIKERLRAARAAGRGEEVELELWRTGQIPREDLVLSGSFTLRGGTIVPPNLPEEGARQQRDGQKAGSTSRSTSGSGAGLTPTFEADEVIPDDLIVQQRLCVGFDCVDGESFGFDTIRLKESNTRLKFEDTSSTSFHPSNDWQLTANDSVSGGSNKLSIEDITGARIPFTVNAGAASNSIYVDSTGRVGFRTSTPVIDLHVNTSSTPGIRLEQSSSGGSMAQTWDVAGNEANFFVRDVTGGSRMPFRIRPGAPTSSIDISASGNVGVGTASPAVKLHVNTSTDGAAAVRLQSSSATGFPGIEFDSDANVNVGYIGGDNQNDVLRINSTRGNDLVLLTESVERLRIDSDGDVGINCNNPTSDLIIASGAGCSTPSSSINAGSTQFTAASSRTFKENLSPVKVPDILDKIASIEVFNYDFIQGPKDRIGLVAEDFHNVFGRGSDKYIQGDEVQMALWLAVQQLAAQNKELIAQNKELMERQGAMEADLAALRSQLPELFTGAPVARGADLLSSATRW